MRVALYARYSSDNQRDASIADQLRECRAYAERQGWSVVEEYTDHAISGASMMRAGIQAILADSGAGRYDIILTEALDRLSRDQEDIAGIFKRMSFVGVTIFTLAEGEVSQLHIGLKGTMNALFLKDLADKTRRGLRGKVEQGKSGGGNAYGYRVANVIAANGDVARGDRKIDLFEAAIVVRILTEYASGVAGKKIAARLNAEGVRAPGGGDWGTSTIIGNRKRGIGIINNELYIGKLVWNRQKFVKDPVTGRRQARPNPENAWVITDVPELRIVPQELWDRVKQRQAEFDLNKNEGETQKVGMWDRRRPRYLLSGLVKCGACGGGYAMISNYQLGCSAARNKGTCTNRINVRRDRLEGQVLSSFRDHLLHPELFRDFCEEFTSEFNRSRADAVRSRAEAEAELLRIGRQLERLVDLIVDGGPANELNRRMLDLEARRAQLEANLASMEEPPALLHPRMADYFHQQIEKMASIGDVLDEEAQAAARDVIRSLVCEIVIQPDNGHYRIEIKGDLASILNLASRKHKSPLREGANVQLNLVAGAGFEPATFRL